MRTKKTLPPTGRLKESFAEKAKGSASGKFHKQKGLEACGLQPLLKLKKIDSGI
jgi:hypothetical protein